MKNPLITILERRDPTRTRTLREKLATRLSGCYKRAALRIKKKIVKENFFNVKKEGVPLRTLSAAYIENPTLNAFEYRWDESKIDSFIDWLERMFKEEVLFSTSGPPSIIFSGRWTDLYIDTAYQQGIREARMEFERAGHAIPGYGASGPTLSAAFNQPIHVGPLLSLYTRVWTDLKGVNAATASQISRVLALGIAEGRGVEAVAREMAGRCDKIGRTRARLIARTEMVRAFNEAKLKEYEAHEIRSGEAVKVQWWTALDERVRDSHKDRHGKVYTKRVAVGMLGEPNCRCSLLPVFEDEEEFNQ
jgi:SPP1 gp7 family putative phage head morphogenesis protein